MACGSRLRALKHSWLVHGSKVNVGRMCVKMLFDVDVMLCEYLKKSVWLGDFYEVNCCRFKKNDFKTSNTKSTVCLFCCTMRADPK